MVTLNNVAGLIEFLNNNELPTLVGEVVFAGELLDHVRANGNDIGIDEDLGFWDDGGWIRIDDDGYVVEDFAIC